MYEAKNIFRIVLTGGPCAGKTSMLEILKNHYLNCGYKVITLSETSTEISNFGISWRDCNINIYEYQLAIFNLQLIKENISYHVLKNSDYNKSLIILDRGLLDGKAYIEESLFQKIQSDFGFVEENNILMRYDMILHLETVANRFEELYEYTTNKARTASIQEAQLWDDKINKIWKGHPNYKFIESLPSYEQKIEKVIKIISTYLKTYKI